MRVLWISDFGIKHSIGGAQRSNHLVIEEGKKQGHSITEFNYDSNHSLLNNGYDLVVSSNLEILYNNFPDIIQHVVSRPQRHVRLEHDSNRYLKPEDRELLFDSCDKAFFLTNFHYNQFVDMYGEIFRNVEIVPDPIDTDLFYDYGQKREDPILYIGYMHYLKGTDSFFEYVSENADKNFAMAAWGTPHYERIARSFSNIEWLGIRDHKEMAKLYNQYKVLHYHPVFFEPFCRTVGEALLCGMELNCNDLIGSLHHFKEVGREEFIRQSNTATQMFWDKAEECFV